VLCTEDDLPAEDKPDDQNAAPRVEDAEVDSQQQKCCAAPDPASNGRECMGGQASVLE
jgi:hypothetical protein